MRMRRISIGGAVAAIVLGVMAAPAAAGFGDDLKARVSRHEDHGWKQQLKNVSLDSGESKKFYLKVRSLTGEAEPALLWQLREADPPYVTKYYKGGKNITAAVNTYTEQDPSGFEFTANPDRSKKFKVKVKADDNPAPGNECVTQFWTLQGDTAPNDATNIGINSECA